MEYLVGFISLLLLVSILVIFNLLKKLEKMEEAYDNVVTDLEKQNEYISQVSKLVEISDKKLKDIDDRGAFAADDEIGWFFEHVQQIQEVLNNVFKK